MIERDTNYESPRTNAYVGAVANLSLQGISVALVNDTLSDTEEYKVRRESRHDTCMGVLQ